MGLGTHMHYVNVTASYRSIKPLEGLAHTSLKSPNRGKVHVLSDGVILQATARGVVYLRIALLEMRDSSQRNLAQRGR
jgi:hypothetical protein